MGIKPDDVKNVLDKEAVNSAVFGLGDRKLPSIFFVLLPARDTKAVYRDSRLAEVNLVKAGHLICFAVRKCAHLFLGQVLDAVEEFVKVVDLTVLTIECGMVGIIEFQ